MVKASPSRLHMASVDGLELEYEVHGDGEAVLFIHGAIIADAFAPLVSLPTLEPYQLVSYHRRGFAGSTHPAGPTSIAQQAADARGLLDWLGIAQAHIVGHSFGAAVALQLALDGPERVHSLSLLEPPLLNAPSAAELMQEIGPAMDLFNTGDKRGAIAGFMQAVAGPKYREALDLVLEPDWFERAVADADTFFEIEMPSLGKWVFTPELASRISQPVLSVLGAESASVSKLSLEVHELLQAWMPQAETFVLPGATHALQLMNPRGMAERLAESFKRHAMPVSG